MDPYDMLGSNIRRGALLAMLIGLSSMPILSFGPRSASGYDYRGALSCGGGKGRPKRKGTPKRKHIAKMTRRARRERRLAA